MNKVVFIGIFDKSFGITKFWKWQAIPIVFFNLMLPLLFLGTFKQYSVGPIGLLVYFIFVFLLELVGLKKVWSMYRLYQKANTIMRKHKNKDLVDLFDKTPRVLFASFVLDIMLPFTWPISFMVKFLFYKNLFKIYDLMVTREKRDED